MNIDDSQLIANSLSLLEFDFKEFQKTHKFDLLKDPVSKLKQKPTFVILYFIFTKIIDLQELNKFMIDCYPLYNQETIIRFKQQAFQVIQRIDLYYKKNEPIMIGRSVLECENQQKMIELLQLLLSVAIHKQLVDAGSDVPVFEYKTNSQVDLHKLELSLFSIKNHILIEQNKTKKIVCKQQRSSQQYQQKTELIIQQFQKMREKELELQQKEKQMVFELGMDYRLITDTNYGLERTRWIELVSDVHQNLKSIDRMIQQHGLYEQFRLDLQKGAETRIFKNVDVNLKFKQFEEQLDQYSQLFQSRLIEQNQKEVQAIKKQINSNYLELQKFKEQLALLF